MLISNHILQHPKAVKIACSKNKEKFQENYPDSIVLHYTGSGNPENTAHYLADDTTESSTHLIIGRAGEIFQLVPFDTIAWHTLKNEYKGRYAYNNFSIGIELDNAGILQYKNNVYKTQSGKTIPTSEVIKCRHLNEQNERYWHKYTNIQLNVCKKICLLLIKNYKISEILGNYEISPKRKQDPGPAFPLEEFRSKELKNLIYDPSPGENSI